MKFAVYIIESERGWGQRIDETKIFDSKDYNGDAELTYKTAAKFVNKFNSQNNKEEVPDWYMRAYMPIIVDDELENGNPLINWLKK